MNSYQSSLATHLASLRKVNEVNQPHPPITTPAEFSRLKHEREVKYQEKQEQYRQQILAHQRVRIYVFMVYNCLYLLTFPIGCLGTTCGTTTA